MNKTKKWKPLTHYLWQPRGKEMLYVGATTNTDLQNRPIQIQGEERTFGEYRQPPNREDKE